MPYKKESPFANFRDPKRTTKNYNPTNFQMPDISSIYSKTADGEKTDEVDDTKKTDDKTVDLINKGEKTKQEATEGPVTRKSLRQNRRAGEKEFNKELRRNRRLSKASSKDITAEERDFYERATRDIQKEKDFRKKAAKLGENPADIMLKPMKTIEGGNVSTEKSKIPTRPGGNIEVNNDMRTDIVKPTETKKEPEKEIDDLMGKLGIRDAANVTKFKTNTPIDARRMAIATKLGYTKPQSAIFGSADEDTEDFNTSMKRNKKEMEDLRISKGFNMKQVNSKGSGFPMVSPLNAVTAGSEMQQQNARVAGEQPMQPMQNQQQGGIYGNATTTVTPNRAGKGQNSNILTSDPNINQPANKVPASTEAQNKFFSTKASSGPSSSPMPPNMVPAPSVGSGVGAGVSSGVGSPAGTFTSTGQGGSGATGINRENLFLNEAAAMYSDGPSKALVGNQHKLPEHLKAKIEAAPGMYGDDRKKPTANEMKKDGTNIAKLNLDSSKRASDNNAIDLYGDARGGMSKTRLKIQQNRYDMDKYNQELKDKEGMNASQRNKYDTDKVTKAVEDYRKSPGMYSPFEFTPGGTRTETGKRSKGGKTTTTYRRDGSKKSEFTEKDSGTKKETRYTGSPRSLSTKAVKVDVKDPATRTYTKYRKDGSVKKTMTANTKGGVDIKKAAKLRTKARRAKKGTKLK